MIEITIKIRNQHSDLKPPFRFETTIRIRAYLKVGIGKVPDHEITRALRGLYHGRIKGPQRSLLAKLPSVAVILSRINSDLGLL